MCGCCKSVRGSKWPGQADEAQRLTAHIVQGVGGNVNILQKLSTTGFRVDFWGPRSLHEPDSENSLSGR